jgi:hypothetical protein
VLVDFDHKNELSNEGEAIPAKKVVKPAAEVKK